MSVKTVFESPYKGGTKQWSNRWHFTGPDWSGQTQFNTFSDWLKAQLVNCIPAATTWVENIGYAPGSDLPEFSKSYGTACTWSRGSSPLCPLEVCALVRFTTTQRSVKNHPLYGFKYMHSVVAGQGGDWEALDSGQKGTYESSLAAIIAGGSDGTNTRFPCLPGGAVFQSRLVEPMVTHRDFPS